LRNLRLTLTLIVLASITAFLACNKYADTTSSYSNNLPEDKLVTASLQGRVLDENGSPVQGAAVSSGTASTTTDANGVFSFTDIQMSSRFGFVKAAKDGYFTGSRSILTDAGSSNFVTITLLPRTSKGSFAASTGGSIVVIQGDTVAFDGGAVVTASTNAAYTGTVHVFAAYLDPTDKDMSSHMPGDLRGIGTDGKETLLQSFGMMVVELEGDAGEKLQIASGKKATLRMAIPASLQGTAPSSIPLWYFNDTTGKWIQQGSADRQGNNYVGQVAHFSWWNCDASSGTVTFKVYVKDQSGNPLAYTYMQFVSSGGYGTRGGYTDANGYASGLIPKGQTLLLQIMNPCGSLVGGANAGPALTDQDLGTITVSDTRYSLVISGNVVDCNNAAVDSGYVTALVDKMPYWAKVSKGAFSFKVQRCSYDITSVSLAAADYVNHEQGSAVVLTADTGKLDAGQLAACGTTIEQYFNISVNGQTYTMNYPVDSIGYWVSGGMSNFNSLPVTGSAGNSLQFGVPTLTGTGTFSVSSFWLNTPNRTYFQNGAMQCTISQFGNLNDYILGGLSGSLRDTISQTNYPMTGTFKVKRTE